MDGMLGLLLDLATGERHMTKRISVRELDPAGGADGQIPVIQSGKFVIGTPPGGSGGSLTVQDENGNVATGVTQIDFQGLGVTAAAGSGEVIVTVPGGGGGGSGALLALTNYNPATGVVVSTTSTTAADADATNLSIAFTAPASGQVIVRLNALGTQTASGASVRWYIREGTTTVGVRYMTASKNTAWDFLGAATYVVTGLTPGSSHTYKWGHSVSSGQSNISAGGTTGAAIMEVWAA